MDPLSHLVPEPRGAVPHIATPFKQRFAPSLLDGGTAGRSDRKIGKCR
jgi:hypothetical protein